MRGGCDDNPSPSFPMAYAYAVARYAASYFRTQTIWDDAKVGKLDNVKGMVGEMLGTTFCHSDTGQN